MSIIRKSRFFFCFTMILLISIGMSSFTTRSTSFVGSNLIPISNVILQRKAIVFSTDQIEWLGAYSANTRVTDINNDNIDDFFIGGYSGMRVFFGHTGEWSNHSVSEADATLIKDNGGILNPVGIGDVNNDGFPDVLMVSVKTGSLDTNVHLIFGGNSSNWSIDTPISDADVTFLAEASNDYMGHGMDGVGDVNQDGYNDFVITSEFNNQAYTQAGKAYLIFGRATSAWNTSMKIAEASSASFLGTEAYGWLGMNAAGVGDVNNDGFDDFLLGGAAYSPYKIRENYLIFGRPTHQWQKDVSKNDVINITFRFKTENMLGNAAGRFMSGVGDVNKDTLDDFIVGAYLDDEGGTDVGQSFLFFGRSNELWPSTPSLVDATDYANASFIGVSTKENSGYSVSGAGDINADGYDDILIGASNGLENIEGKAYVIFGRATDQWVMDQSLSLANMTITGGQYKGSNSRFATDVSGVGDINNDGYADYSISAPWVNNRKGMIFVLFGESSPITYTGITTTTKSQRSSWMLLEIVMLGLVYILIRKKKPRKVIVK